MPRLIPKWVTYISLVAFLVGLGSVVVGPPVLYAVAAASVDAELAPEQLADEQVRNEFQQQKTKELLDQLFWVFPVCGALGFSGAIGLLFVWVSRPLGDDLDQAPPSQNAPVASK